MEWTGQETLMGIIDPCDNSFGVKVKTERPVSFIA